MKPSFTLASTLLIQVAVAAQPSLSANAAKPIPAPPRVSLELPASEPVRITTAPAPGISTPAAAQFTTPHPALATELEPLPELGSPFAWTAPVVSLREIPVTPVRSSRSTEVHGVIPRAARSSNPGIAGALLGFCNLLNPFAPQSLGVETSGENWYDGSVRSNPLPWGLRDERFHEPQTPEFSAEISRWFSFESGRNEPRPGIRIPQGPLLTHVP